MLDLKLIRENRDMVKAGMAKKHCDADIDKIVKLDESRREIIRETESLKAKRNVASAEIAKKKKAGENADSEIAEMRAVGEQIAALDGKLLGLEQELQEKMSWIPNMPHETTPEGKDENDSVLIREWGEKPEQDFKVKPHWEIGPELRILDLEAAARVSGSGFYLLKGMGAKLQRALINFMLDLHSADGFTECVTPYMVKSHSMHGTGQLPKMADDMYKTSDDLWLIPTAEVPVTNMYRDQIIDGKELPLSLVSYSACFRRESGAAGKDTRGMIRVHQFDKVEMVKIVRPENSYNVLEELVKQAEKVLQQLKIQYRVCLLAAGDISFAAAKCYDIELWSAGVEKYLEISSVSNFEDFQARRMNCRYRDEDKKVKYVHTLNGSGLALARLIPAILENYQNPDGTVTIPEVLRPYMGGADRIK